MAASLRKIVCCIALSSFYVQPLLAQDTLSSKLSSQRNWTMSAPRGKPMPDCVEAWTFRADGSMTVESGDEIVQHQWRINGSRSLYLRKISSNGKLDCLGNAYEPISEPQPENVEPLWLLENQSGKLLLCRPKYVIDAKTKKQMRRYDDKNCLGELKPAQ